MRIKGSVGLEMEMVRNTGGCDVGTNNNFCTARHDGSGKRMQWRAEREDNS